MIRRLIKNQFSPLRAASACAACAIMVTGCAKSPAPKHNVLAKVGSAEIRVEDFKREADWRQKNRRSAADKQALLDEMILQQALLQRAHSAGIDTDPQVQREIRNLIVGKLLDREMAARRDAATVTAEETKAEYEKNISKYTRPAKARLSILFLEADVKASDAKRAEQKSRLIEARAKAVGRQRALQQGGPLTPALSPRRGEGEEGFGSLALDCSDDQASRYRGGDIGWLDAETPSSRWPRSVLQTGFALEKGQISEVVEATGGFYLVMKTDSRESVVTPFVQVEPTLKQSLLLKKRQEIEINYRQQAVRQTPVQIDQVALAAVELPLPPAVVAQSRDAGPPTFPGLKANSN